MKGRASIVALTLLFASLQLGERALTTVSGTVTLTFPTGSMVAGGFSAAWRPTTTLCG